MEKNLWKFHLLFMQTHIYLWAFSWKIRLMLNNPENSSTTKTNKHSASSHLLFTHCAFHNTKSKHDYYRRKDFLENVSEDLKKHATKT